MIPQFATKAELFTWLRQNKDLLIHARKAAVKHADAVAGVNTMAPTSEHGGAIVKELGAAAPPAGGILYVKSAINTTNLMDSHMDVHIPGLWKKSLAETKLIYHLQEHKMQFDSVISDNVTAYTKSLTWKALGYDFEGSTQALVFDSTIESKRNAFMFDQYANGYVKNHSVGMRYVKMLMCVNSDEKWWKEEKDNWEKYYGDIVNPEQADDYGMFWAVTEAKMIEGSAVLIGSNGATPTIEVTTEAGKSATSTTIEPEESTRIIKSRFATIGAKINH